MPMQRGQRRPIISELGAQINGPDAKPRTKRLVPSAMTSRPALKSTPACAAAAAKMALLNEAMKVPKQAVVAV